MDEDQKPEAPTATQERKDPGRTIPMTAGKVLERLTGPSVLEQMTAARRALLVNAVVSDDDARKVITDVELGQFLELAALYDLDPYARELWLVKSNSGKLLVLIGRDGIRKIVRRQGMVMDSDAVYSGDTFRVKRSGVGREIIHEYGHHADRGELVGAWAQVTDASGVQVGYHYSPIEEARPNKVHEKAPWAKSPSIMLVANAERQAGRKATPLGGLLVSGEEDLVYGGRGQLEAVDGERDARPLGEFSWEDIGDAEMAEELSIVISAINELAPGSWSAAACQMKLLGRERKDLERILEAAREELVGAQTVEAMRINAQAAVVDAQVVPEKEWDGEEPLWRDGDLVRLRNWVIGTVHQQPEDDGQEFIVEWLTGSPARMELSEEMHETDELAQAAIVVHEIERITAARAAMAERLDGDMLPDEREALVKADGAALQALADLGVTDLEA